MAAMPDNATAATDDRPVRIITDSGSDITDADDKRLEVVPLSVTFGTRTYSDGIDLSHDRFYDLLASSKDMPRTSQPSPLLFADAMRRAISDGCLPVVITLSGTLSGTYEGAIIAADSVASETGMRIPVVDSRQATVGQRIIVERALRMADEGRTASDIVEAVESWRADVRLAAVLDTLEYMARGGRIPRAAAAIGGMLRVKPLISFVDGKIEVIGKAVGGRKARTELTRQVGRLGGIDVEQPFAIGYTGKTGDDASLRKFASEAAWLWGGDTDLPSRQVGATIGTHAGPGGIVIAFFAKEK